MDPTPYIQPETRDRPEEIRQAQAEEIAENTGEKRPADEDQGAKAQFNRRVQGSLVDIWKHDKGALDQEYKQAGGAMSDIEYQRRIDQLIYGDDGYIDRGMTEDEVAQLMEIPGSAPATGTAPAIATGGILDRVVDDGEVYRSPDEIRQEQAEEQAENTGEKRTADDDEHEEQQAKVAQPDDSALKRNFRMIYRLEE